MDFAILKQGTIKSKNYCPNPVVKNGIPTYADAINNPKCKNTPAYNQWWEEQLYYIVNGYTTGGMHIPGRYYKFVNFDTFRGIAGDNLRAEIHDFQLDYAYLIEQSKKEFINIVVPKARRKSVSTMNICMVVDYGYRFELNYKAAIVAGQQKFADEFMTEWAYIDSKCQPEFRLKKLPADGDIVAGWKQKTPDGETINMGTQNSIYSRTVFHDPNVLKGKFLHDIILEESGENEQLLEVIGASEPCLMQGSIQRGTFHIYGTGGNMNKGSKGFKEVYYNASTYNAKTLFIPATVFAFPYYAGAKNPDGSSAEIVPNLMHLKPHERVGMSDEIAAEQAIKKHREELLLKGNLKKYFSYCQENPINVQEVFRKSSSNNFDVIKLNDQGHRILSEDKHYRKFKLEFKKDENGNVLTPYEIEAILATDDTPEHECVLILNNGHPQKNYRNLDVAGIDSYDQDQTRESKSLGAMVVFRRQHNIGSLPGWLPVALIRTRPPTKEQFYEMCMKTSIYYNLIGATLGDVANANIIQYYKEMGCENYISKPPKKFESPNSEAANKYWIRITGYTKPRMIGVLQTFFFNHYNKVWFPNIIDEALDYDEFEVDSDNDTIDALGIALMKALDMEQMVVNEDELLKSNPFAYPEWGTDSRGNIVDKSSSIEINKAEPLGKYEDYFSRQARIMLNDDSDEESFGAGDIYKL